MLHLASAASVVRRLRVVGCTGQLANTVAEQLRAVGRVSLVRAALTAAAAAATIVGLLYLATSAVGLRRL